MPLRLFSTQNPVVDKSLTPNRSTLKPVISLLCIRMASAGHILLDSECAGQSLLLSLSCTLLLVLCCLGGNSRDHDEWRKQPVLRYGHKGNLFPSCQGHINVNKPAIGRLLSLLSSKSIELQRYWSLAQFIHIGNCRIYPPIKCRREFIKIYSLPHLMRSSNNQRLGYLSFFAVNSPFCIDYCVSNMYRNFRWTIGT